MPPRNTLICYTVSGVMIAISLFMIIYGSYVLSAYPSNLIESTAKIIECNSRVAPAGESDLVVIDIKLTLVWNNVSLTSDFEYNDMNGYGCPTNGETKVWVDKNTGEFCPDISPICLISKLGYGLMIFFGCMVLLLSVIGFGLGCWYLKSQYESVS